jgi:peroxiredoxin Q/BCP
MTLCGFQGMGKDGIGSFHDWPPRYNNADKKLIVQIIGDRHMSATDRKPMEGEKAPDFTLPADTVESLSLSDLSGKAIVLFFYPKDDTSGCTKEAIEFTSALPDFRELGVEVIGMSPDPVKKHLKFREKHSLGMPLVADEEKTALEAYGVWVEKSMYGKKYMGVERSTFLIGKDGKVLKAWRKVKVPGHVADVLQAARDLV